MKIHNPNILGRALPNFLSDYLPNVRGLSGNTILSYKYSFILFLRFLEKEKKKSIIDIDIKDIGVEDVIAFLRHLESDRHNGTGSWNVRLSAIHAFFRYLAGIHPEYLDKSQRILNIAKKRGYSREIEFYEFEEVKAVLQAVDRSNRYGLRDYAILALMFNTGARAQEISDLKANDIELTKPFRVKFFGKGKKERICPIMPQTAFVLNEYIDEWRIDLHEPIPVFVNHLRTRLTRFGILYIFKKYTRLAAARQTSLNKKRLHPHSMRHSAAIHLLRSGVDPITISHWLGHSSINTTNKYLKIDLKIKKEALEKAEEAVDGENNTKASWKANPDILKQLVALQIPV